MRPDFSEIPANRFFKFKLVSANLEQAEVRLAIEPNYLQEGGVVHGGIISALADTTAVYALYPSLPANQNMTSIEFKINFVSPAHLENGELKAEARVVKRGRTIGLCDVQVFQQQKLIAKGMFTYLFFKTQNE